MLGLKSRTRGSNLIGCKMSKAKVMRLITIIIGLWKYLAGLNSRIKRRNSSYHKEQKAQALIACATQKGDKPENEDRGKPGRIGDWKVVVIADGVTNCRCGGEAAQIATDVLYSRIEEAGNQGERIGIQVLQEAYEKAVKKLGEEAMKRFGKKEEGYFQTTIIAVIEGEDSFFITYLGDGRSYLMRGDLQQGAQLMVPHGSGNVLRGGLTATGLVSNPVFIEHSKSFHSGEIVIVGTDGAFSDKEAVFELFETLKNKDALLNDTSLQQAIARWLKERTDRGLVTDDATVGILISDKAHKILTEKSQCGKS